MKQADFTRLDTMAVLDGGKAGGAYLDKIERTDLASLTESQWVEFLMRVIGGYREALKGRLKAEAPF